MIYFISDLHFGHDRDFIYTPRGFSSVQEHNEKIIANWNSVITDEDIVYVLGDLMLGDSEAGIQCIKQLKGQIKFIRGNHDTDTKVALYCACPNIIEDLGYAQLIKYKKWQFYLSHYPTCVGNGNEDGWSKLYCLCGHVHTKDKFLDIDKRCYHVDAEAHNCTPISINEIIEDLKTIRQA